MAMDTKKVKRTYKKTGDSKRTIIKCKHCGTINKGLNKIYCSVKCYNLNRAVPKKEIKCKHCNKIFYKYPHRIKYGGGKFCSHKCYHLHPRSDEFKQKISKAFRGAGHPRWKGGIDKGRKDRNRIEYKNWRKEVFERDMYTCQLCMIFNHTGLGKSIRLNAHHLKSWTKYPELRYKASNGLTLCEECHDNFRKVDLSELAKTREIERYIECA